MIHFADILNGVVLVFCMYSCESVDKVKFPFCFLKLFECTESDERASPILVSKDTEDKWVEAHVLP